MAGLIKSEANMTKPLQHRGPISRFHLRIAAASLLAVALAPAVQAQTFTVLYNFKGSDGSNPYAGLIRDTAGNLYGTTLNGGTGEGHGTVFKLDSAGVLTTVYGFQGRGDGNKPSAGVIRDPAGNLFGTTPTGIGHKFSMGIIYRISSTGREAKPHVFTGPPSDGSNPQGGLIRDNAGTLYGTTAGGGAAYAGTVFKLNAGKETLLYSFTGTNGDGAYPEGTLVRDTSGNLYGTTSSGGSSAFGTVFRLDTTGKETVLHSFSGTDGAQPVAGLILDKAGNLYGTTRSGLAGAGTIFKIDTSGGNFSVLYTFSGGADGSLPRAPVVMDPSGNLYGTTRDGGDPSCGQSGEGCGVVFELKTTGEEIVLHKFSGPDGMAPSSGLVRDAAGNLYGTAPRGGTGGCGGSGCGVVFKITP